MATLTHTTSGGDYGAGAVQPYVNDGTGYVAGQGAAVTVRDNDDPIPGAFFRSASSDAVEHGGTHNVRVDLNYPAPSGGLTLRYSLSGTATAGSSNDFTIQNSGSLSIAAGDSIATIPVAINDDSTEESAETVILTLIGRTGYTLDSTTVYTLTITDNDTPPTNACVSSSLLADVKGYAGEHRPNSLDHVERWSRVLAAFGESNDFSNNPMTLAEAQAQADRGLQRWGAGGGRACLVRATPSDAPVISIAGVDDNGNGIVDSISEGGTAKFTLTATPAPTNDLHRLGGREKLQRWSRER